MQTHDTPEKTYDLERLIFFSDGVFAIVITLLVIELHPPPHWDRTLAGLIATQWRSLTAYAVSFLAVGAYWNAHRGLFGRVVRFHAGLVLLNFLLLFLVVLLPFAAELIFETGPRGEPFAILLGLIAAIGLAQAMLWGFAAFVAKVVDPKVLERDRLLILAAMMMAPLFVGLASAAVASGSTQSFFYIVPLIAVAGLARRRLIRRPKTAA
jgi:uncharacterized membrane protein